MSMREFPDKTADACACPNHPRTRYQLLNINTAKRGGVYDHRSEAEAIIEELLDRGMKRSDYRIEIVDDTIDCGGNDNLSMCLFCNRTLCDGCRFTIIVALADSIPSDADYQRELGHGWIACGECKMRHESGRIHVHRCSL